MRGQALTFFVLALLAQAPLVAQLRVTLKPKTVGEFQAYVRITEAGLEERWNGRRAFLLSDEKPEWHEKLLKGEVIIEDGSSPNPRSIDDGLIHDWWGAVFVSNKNISEVLRVLQDFAHHPDWYPQIKRSRLIRHVDNDFTGYWRLEEKGQALPAVFDLTQTAHYKNVAKDKWICVSHADDIRAVDDAGSKHEHVNPPGEGMGLMWKLYSYWSLQQVSGGVVAECRTVSLSRGVPGALAWMVRPFVRTVPRDSLESTLRNTRKALGD
jgi:hypothetical protein